MQSGDSVDAAIDAKRFAVLRRIEERQEAREKALTESTRNVTKAAQEEFLSSFHELRAKFLDLLEAAKEGCVDVTTSVESAAIVLHELQNFLNGRVAGLPAYRVQQLQNELDQYYTSVTELRQKHFPKKRFGFKKPANPSVVPVKPVKLTTDAVFIPIDSRNYISFTEKSDCEHDFYDVDGKDILLNNLTRCRIVIHGTPATVHATNIADCEICTGPVRTSIFIDFCVSSTLQIACQQLRIHSSKHCKFFTYVSSRAIIEDCQDIEFGPYNRTYPDIEKDFDKCGFSRERNNWKSIDDFNWLALDKPSPNWRLVSERDGDEKSH